MSAIRLSGRLARDARHMVDTKGTAYIEVAVSQGEKSVDAVARRRVGVGNGAQFVAQRTAAHLRAGARVTVHAAHFEINRREGVLYLHGVDHIEHHTEAPAIAGAQPERESA